MTISVFPLPVDEPTVLDPMPVCIVTPTAAFGEVSTAPNTPLWGASFTYGLLPQLVDTVEQNGGTATNTNETASVQSGALANGCARITSTRSLQYNAGVGAMMRGTAIFDTPTADSSQLAGIDNLEDSLRVGYPQGSSDFSVLRERGGKLHIATLEVTTASTTAENVTVTLNGIGASVAVTNSGSTTATAWEIAQGDYSTTGNSGWHAHVNGSTVYFVYQDSSDESGTFTLTATTAVATFATSRAGAAPTQEIITQANFNRDKLDGTGASGITLDPLTLNVFQIKFQYLGAGMMYFEIENPETGLFIPFHCIEFANANTVTSLGNPSLRWSIEAIAYSAGNDVTMSSASAALFLQGEQSDAGQYNSINVSQTGVGTTLTPIVSIRGKGVFKDRISFVENLSKQVSVSVDGTKPASVQIIVNGTLDNAAVWTDIDANSSVEYDSSATTITGGEIIRSVTLAKSDGVTLDNLGAEFWFDKERTLTLAVQATSGTTDVAMAGSWREGV